MNPTTLQLAAMSTVLNTTAKDLYPIVETKNKYDSFMKFMNKQTSYDRQKVDAGITGLSMASFVSEGGIPTPDAPIAGFQKVYTQQQIRKDSRLGFYTFYYMFKIGDKSKITEGLGQELKKVIVNNKEALDQTKDYYAQTLLAQGFTTSFVFSPLNDVYGQTRVVDTTTADGVQFWSTAHLREDNGPNWSTVIFDGATPSPEVSMAALESMHVIHGLKKDGRGMPYLSQIDTIFCVANTPTHQTLKRIKKDLDAGRYPAQLPGQNGSFNEAPTISSFEILALPRYGGLALPATAWGGFDSTKVSDEEGFQYIVTLENTMVDLPQQANYDYLLSATAMFEMGCTNIRPFMYSAGDNTTTAA